MEGNKLYAVIKPDADYTSVIAVCSDRARAIEIAEADHEGCYWKAYVKEFTDGVQCIGKRV